MTNEVPEPTIERFRALYDTADGFAKRVALANLEAEIPAHNELRYAGHHFLKSIDDQGNPDKDELRRAIAHCERAMYEAAEAGIVALLEELKDFETRYRGIVIGKVVPEIRKIREVREQAIQLLSRPRPHSSEAPHETSEYMQIFDELHRGKKHLDQNLHDLDAELQTRQKEEYARHEAEVVRHKQIIREKRNDRLTILGILLTILGILLSIIL